MDEAFAKPRTKSLLEHVAAIQDSRQPCKIMYPLPEVLLLVVCATIASCDDYAEIVAWGEAHLVFLRRFQPYHWGVPCEDWLRVVMNRIDPALFAACFTAWVAERRPDAVDLVAIDGKTSRRSYDRSTGKKALHLVSAWATTERMVLGQEAVDETSNEITAIPLLLDRLALQGALVTIDAIACNPTIAAAIRQAGAEYLLAVKDNQPSLRSEMARYFDTAPAAEIETHTQVEKGHGRLETRRHVVSTTVDWMAGSRHYPGEPRFPDLTTLGMVERTVEKAGEISCERRYYICSAALDVARFADAVRTHWTIENQLHWVLDVQFKEDQSRLRAPACAPATAPRTWPSSATSPSTSCAPPATAAPSRPAENSPAGIPATCTPSSNPHRINLNSVPWLPLRSGARQAIMSDSRRATALTPFNKLD